MRPAPVCAAIGNAARNKTHESCLMWPRITDSFRLQTPGIFNSNYRLRYQLWTSNVRRPIRLMPRSILAAGGYTTSHHRYAATVRATVLFAALAWVEGLQAQNPPAAASPVDAQETYA